MVHNNVRNNSYCALSVAAHGEGNEPAVEGLERLRNGSATVLYLHVFKSGGTSLCSAAAAAKWRTPPVDAQPNSGLFQGNCNVPPGYTLGLNSGQQLASSSSLSWLGDVNAQRWRFVGLEFDGLPTNDFLLPSPRCAVWIIQLRDPRDRMLSHFYIAQAQFRCLRDPGVGVCAGRHNPSGGESRHLWARQLDSWDGPNYRALESMHDGKGFGDRAFHFSAFLQFLSKGGKSKLGPRHPLAPLVSGDFAARHLCGFDACAAGECGDACIDVAQRRLRDWFSIILTTEGLDLWGWPVLQELLGLNAPSHEMKHVNSAVGSRPGCNWRGCKARELVNPSSALGEFLDDLLDLDLQLYAFATNLAAERHHKFGARPLTSTTNAKCEAQVVKELSKRPRGWFTASQFSETALKCGLDQPAQSESLFRHLEKRKLIGEVAKGLSRQKMFRVLSQHRRA